KKMFIRTALLFYIYPAVSYLTVGITPDLFVYLYQPFFIYFVYTKKHVLNTLLLLMLYQFQDDGAIINIVFLVVYLFYRMINIYNSKVIKAFIIILYGIFVAGLYYISRKYILLISEDTSQFVRIAQTAIIENGTMYTK